jgi:hypothetical protein
LDIAPKSPPAEDRVIIVQGSQSDPERLLEVSAQYGPFDIILDDGSHFRDDIFASMDTLFPVMKDGGVYVIEDTQTSYWPNAQGSLDLDARDTTMGRLRALANDINHAEIRLNDPAFAPDPLAFSIVEISFCHNLCFLIKGQNTEPSNFAQKAHYPHLVDALAIIDTEVDRAAVNTLAFGEVLYNRSRILLHMGRNIDAIENQKRAVASAPESLRQWSRLARIQEEATDWLGAAESYRTVAGLSGNHPFLVEKLHHCCAEISKIVALAEAAKKVRAPRRKRLPG